MNLAVLDGVRRLVRKPRPKPEHPVATSQAGLKFIGRFEGLVLQPYNDVARNATIGYGHLIHYGPVTKADVKHYLGFNAKEALDLLSEDARKAENAVKQCVRVHLTQPQFDALVSFAFNCGGGALASSQLLRDLNAGRYQLVPGDLMHWVYAGGQKSAGLVSRRRAEGELFAHGNYQQGV